MPTPNYAAWPTQADIQRRLSSAGLTLRLTGSDLTTRFAEVVDEVTTEITRVTLRQFIADTVDTQRTYDGTGTAELEVDDMVSLTSVTIVGIQTAPGYTMSGVMLVGEYNKPQTRIVAARGSQPAFITEGIIVPVPTLFPAGRQNITVTDKFGYGAEIPRDLWQAVCGEMAHRLATEAVFDPAGRVNEWQEGDERERRSLAGASDTEWHGVYEAAIHNYRRRAGRRLRNFKPRLI